jgi:hypothetical protein
VTGLALVVALGLGIATLRSMRFVEYWPPFVALFTCLAAADLFASGRLQWVFRRSVGAGALAVLGLAALANLVEVRRSYDQDVPWGHLERVAKEAARISKPGDLVFNAVWGDFAELFFWNHQNRYIAGLDPTFTWAEDPSRFAAYRAIGEGRLEPPGFFIESLFGARLAVSGRSSGLLATAAKPGSGLVEAFRDDGQILYRVEPVEPERLVIEGRALRPQGSLAFKCQERSVPGAEGALCCQVPSGQSAGFEIPVPSGEYSLSAEIVAGPAASAGAGASTKVESVQGPRLERLSLPTSGTGDLCVSRFVLTKLGSPGAVARPAGQ